MTRHPVPTTDRISLDCSLELREADSLSAPTWRRRIDRHSEIRYEFSSTEENDGCYPSQPAIANSASFGLKSTAPIAQL